MFHAEATTGVWCLKRRKGKRGEWVTLAQRLTHINVTSLSSNPSQASDTCTINMVVAIFKSCMIM